MTTILSVSVEFFLLSIMFRFFVRRRPRRLRRRGKAPAAHFRTHKEFARERISTRLAYWNSILQFPYGRVAIRNQSSRWGSCSKKGNLNFNYRIAFLPEHLMDYVIVHELCHLKEFNHSERFWTLVAEILPDYKNAYSDLKAINQRILMRTTART